MIVDWSSDELGRGLILGVALTTLALVFFIVLAVVDCFSSKE